MTLQYIEQSLYDIAKDISNDYNTQIESLSPAARTERKALTVQREMAGLCIRAGLLWHTTGHRGPGMTTRLLGEGHFLAVSDPVAWQAFRSLDPEAQSLATPYLHGMYFMITQFLVTWKKELVQAESAMDARGVFELSLKITTVLHVMRAWRAWWQNHADELPALPPLPLIEEVLAGD